MMLKKIAGSRPLTVAVVMVTMAAAVGTIGYLIYAGNTMLAAKAYLGDQPYRRAAYLACMVIPYAVAVVVLVALFFGALEKHGRSVKE